MFIHTEVPTNSPTWKVPPFPEPHHRLTINWLLQHRVALTSLYKRNHTAFIFLCSFLPLILYLWEESLFLHRAKFSLIAIHCFIVSVVLIYTCYHEEALEIQHPSLFRRTSIVSLFVWTRMMPSPRLGDRNSMLKSVLCSMSTDMEKNEEMPIFYYDF